jgi:hypothetical protein
MYVAPSTYTEIIDDTQYWYWDDWWHLILMLRLSMAQNINTEIIDGIQY